MMFLNWNISETGVSVQVNKQQQQKNMITEERKNRQIWNPLSPKSQIHEENPSADVFVKEPTTSIQSHKSYCGKLEATPSANGRSFSVWKMKKMLKCIKPAFLLFFLCQRLVVVYVSVGKRPSALFLCDLRGFRSYWMQCAVNFVNNGSSKSWNDLLIFSPWACGQSPLDHHRIRTGLH